MFRNLFILVCMILMIICTSCEVKEASKGYCLLEKLTEIFINEASHGLYKSV